MEVEHNIIGMNNAVRCASVIALPLAARIPGSGELIRSGLVMAICTVQSLQMLVGINTGYSSSPADPAVVRERTRNTASGRRMLAYTPLSNQICKKENLSKPYNLEIE